MVGDSPAMLLFLTKSVRSEGGVKRERAVGQAFSRNF